MWGFQSRRVLRACSQMSTALGLVLACPATVATAPGHRARRAADRLVALIVQRVVRQVVLEDVAPEVLVGPVGERVQLPDAALLVLLELGRAGPRRRLLAADAGDPGIDAGRAPARARRPWPGRSSWSAVHGAPGSKRRSLRSAGRSAPRTASRSRASPGTARPCRS